MTVKEYLFNLFMSIWTFFSLAEGKKTRDADYNFRRAETLNGPMNNLKRGEAILRWPTEGQWARGHLGHLRGQREFFYPLTTRLNQDLNLATEKVLKLKDATPAYLNFDQVGLSADYRPPRENGP